MNKTVSSNIRRVLHLLTSVATIVGGACLIGGCLYIYFGQGAYSRQAAAEVLSRIAVPLYVWIGLTVIGLVWGWLSPAQDTRAKAPKAYTALLARLHATHIANDETQNAIATEHARRRRHKALRLLAVGFGAAGFLFYALNPAHYTADINASMIRAVWVAIPCFTIPFVTELITAQLIDKSYQREIELLKALPRVEPSAPAVSPITKTNNRTLMVVRVILIVLAIAALVYGLTAGGTVDVLTKAINICTECIGLG